MISAYLQIDGFSHYRYCSVALGLVTLLIGVISNSLASEATRPNIVFILGDDVGSEVLGCYGGESYRTPRLDRMAEEGMLFEHAYAMPVCHPTRLCLLTGQYPFRLGNPEWGTFPASAECRTFAQMLKRSGYVTAIAGKWQLTLLDKEPDHPHRLGFEEYCLFGWHEGPRYFDPYIRQNGVLRTDVQDRYGPDVYCEFLIDFMERHRAQPFFAYYSMALCHAVTNDLDQPVPVGPNGRYQNYAEMVAAMDERVGRILDAVDQLGLRDNTVVIYIADNGSPSKNIDGVTDGKLVTSSVVSLRDGMCVPGGKSQLTDSGTRVPMLARWPGTIEAGRVMDDLIDISDFLPTFADLAAAKLPVGVVIDGRSFAARLQGLGAPVRDWVFAEHKGRAFVKNHRWKVYSDGAVFDLQQDPTEQAPVVISNLTADKREEIKQLKLVIQDLHAAGLPMPASDP